MKLAIMQPYLFPYIGYFQLINAVDKFVIYDDVNFIKQGWINRNNILINNSAHLFTVPLSNQSSFSKINSVMINEKLYSPWVKKFIKSVELSYNKAPFFNEIFPLLHTFFLSEENYISNMASKSLKLISDYIGITTSFEYSSVEYANKYLNSQERVLDICKQEKATQYINPIGGIEIYTKELFENAGIELNFIKTNFIEYKQFKNEFIPGLSIIDVLMFNSKEKTKEMLVHFKLI